MTVTIEKIGVKPTHSRFRLSQLVSLLEVEATYGFYDVPIEAAKHDSRTLKENDLFVAIRGELSDGHEFAQQAVAGGAKAVVAERQLPLPPHIPQIIVPDSRTALATLASFCAGEPSRRLISIAVTGTNGKTTVSYLLQSVLQEAGILSGRLGTVSYDLGDIEVPAKTTTPDPISTHNYLAHMCASGCQAVVIETSSHALLQQRTACIDFDAAVFTNLSRDHLDYHKTMEEYLRAKGLLFAGLKSDALAILNADDPASRYYADLCKARVITYGIKSDAQVRAREITTNLRGTEFLITGLGPPLPLHTSMVGVHNIYNCLAAAACARELGPSQAAIRTGLESCPGPPGRLEKVDAGQDFTVLVDYAHTDDALDKVLSALKPLCGGRLLLVFGCGGNRDRGKRPRMAAVAQRWADHIWLTSDNSRDEDPDAIIDDIRKGITQPDKFSIFPDRREAIAEATRAARADDLVLIAGKGHEATQIYQDRAVPFDDREVARESIRQRAAPLVTI